MLIHNCLGECEAETGDGKGLFLLLFSFYGYDSIIGWLDVCESVFLRVSRKSPCYITNKIRTKFDFPFQNTANWKSSRSEIEGNEWFSCSKQICEIKIHKKRHATILFRFVCNIIRLIFYIYIWLLIESIEERERGRERERERERYQFGGWAPKWYHQITETSVGCLYSVTKYYVKMEKRRAKWRKTLGWHCITYCVRAIIMAIRCWTLLHTIGNFARYHYQSNGLYRALQCACYFLSFSSRFGSFWLCSTLLCCALLCSVLLGCCCCCYCHFLSSYNVFFPLDVCLCFLFLSHFPFLFANTIALSFLMLSLVACLLVAWLVWAYRFILSIVLSFELSCPAPGIFIFAPLYTHTEWVKLQSNRIPTKRIYLQQTPVCRCPTFVYIEREGESEIAGESQPASERAS